MLVPAEIETGHLIGRPVRVEDLPHYIRLQTDPDVTKTLGGIADEATIKQRLNSAVGHWMAHGFGEYVFFSKLDPTHFAGRAFLRHKMIDGESAIELGYAYMPEFWGQGHGSAVAGLLIKQAFETLRVDEVLSFTLVTNVASRRVMEKNGFTYSHQGVYAGFPHVFLRLSCLAWQSAQANQRHL